MEDSRGIDTDKVEEYGSNETEQNRSSRASNIDGYPLVVREKAGGGEGEVGLKVKSNVDLGADCPGSEHNKMSQHVL